MRCPVLIGRDPELSIFDQAWERARSGCGSWLGVCGEAGTGKTRLVSEWAVRVRAGAAASLVGRCSSVDRGTPHRPIVEALFAMGAEHDRPPRDDIAPFVAMLAPFLPRWRDGAPARVSDSPAVLGESVLRILAWLAGDRAALLVVEDLHWADAETLAVCDYLIDHVDDVPVVIAATWRADEASVPHPNKQPTNHTDPDAPVV